MLSFKYTSKRFSLSILNNNKKSMIIFEELVDLRNSKMINHLKFMNLFFKEYPLITSNFVFIDNIDGSGHRWYFMDSFSKFIKLILLEARRKHVIFLFNTSLYLFDKIVLLEFYIIFFALSHHISCTLLMNIILCCVAHIYSILWK